jgi:hypothetical protein
LVNEEMVLTLLPVALAIIAAWYHVVAIDGLPGLVVGWVVSDDTEYAPGYSDSAFRAVHEGMTSEQLMTVLGPPLGEVWMIEPDKSDRCLSVYVENDRVVHGCENRGVVPGMFSADAGSRLVIREVSWLYARSPKDTHYRMRVVHLAQGRIVDVRAAWYLD